MPVATITTTDLSSLELVEVWSKTDSNERVRFDFPISGETGATGASVAYAVIEPGGAIPTHHDSANEVDIILEGDLGRRGQFDRPGGLGSDPRRGQAPRPQSG